MPRGRPTNKVKDTKLANKWLEHAKKPFGAEFNEKERQKDKDLIKELRRQQEEAMHLDFEKEGSGEVEVDVQDMDEQDEANRDVDFKELDADEVDEEVVEGESGPAVDTQQRKKVVEKEDEPQDVTDSEANQGVKHDDQCVLL